MEAIPPVIIESPEKADSAVVFLHGFGDEGSSARQCCFRAMWLLIFLAAGYQNLAEQIHKAGKLQTTRFIYPTAPYSHNEGERAWYPLKTGHMDEDVHGDLEDYMPAVKTADDLIAEQESAGISRSRIFLGGFSQGSAVTHLWSILKQEKSTKRIAGLLSVAGYMPMRGKFKELAQSDAKVIRNQPFVVIHGQQDTMLPLWVAQKGIPILEDLGFEVNWAVIPDMRHDIPGKALGMVCQFIESVLADTEGH